VTPVPQPAAEPAVYGGWQAEATGFVGGTSLPEFLLAATAVVLAVAPVYATSWAVAVLTLPASAVFATLAFVRVGGLGAGAWVCAAGRHLLSVAGRRNLFASGVFAPWVVTGDGRGGGQPMDLPGVLARLLILPAATGTGTQVAVVHDPGAHTFTAVLRLRYPGLALADADEQNRRVAAWGAFLASLCIENGPISRVAAVQRAQPDDGTALASWTRQHTAGQAPETAVRSLTGLLRDCGPAGAQRETYLSVTLAAQRARPALRAAGGGPAGAAAVLVRELFAMQASVAAADLGVEAWLGPRELSAVIRTGFDPDSVRPLAARRAAHHRSGSDTTGLEPGVDPAVAGPAAAHTSWSTYRHDGAYSVTFQVRDWPRSAVLASSLHPLLRARTGARRSFALVCEPMGPRRARRALARDRTKRHVLVSLRRRSGRLDSPDELAELSRAEGQDRARAAGHGLLRFVGLVTVTVTDPQQLEAACADVQADAAAARVELRRLYGAQDSGFAAWVLPLGQGLPARRVDL
jgi:hypothetical protein